MASSSTTLFSRIGGGNGGGALSASAPTTRESARGRPVFDRGNDYDPLLGRKRRAKRGISTPFRGPTAHLTVWGDYGTMDNQGGPPPVTPYTEAGEAIFQRRLAAAGKKRNPRRGLRPLRPVYQPDRPRFVNSACTAAAYNLKELKEYYERRGLTVKDLTEVVYVRFDATAVPGTNPASQSDKGSSAMQRWYNNNTENEEEPAEVFYFEYGVVVWWGPSESWGRLMVLSELKHFEAKPEEHFDLETCDYSYVGENVRERDDQGSWKATPSPRPSLSSARAAPVIVGTATSGDERAVERTGRFSEGETEEDTERDTEDPTAPRPERHQRLEKAMEPPPPPSRESHIHNDHFVLADHQYETKLAFSHALAQSAKLMVFEDRIDNVIENTRQYPEKLAEHGTVDLTKTDIAKLKGRLFLHRMDINLHSDILDTPDYFWDHTELEPLYVSCRKYMEINRRVEILNQRLDVVHELFAMLSDELNQKHGAKLEWIIIVLILIEVVVGLASIAITMFFGGHTTLA